MVRNLSGMAWIWHAPVRSIEDTHQRFRNSAQSDPGLTAKHRPSSTAERMFGFVSS